MKHNSKNNHRGHDEYKEHDHHRKYDDYKKHDHHHKFDDYKAHDHQHDHDRHHDRGCNLENCHENGLLRVRIFEPNNFSLDQNTNIITVENDSATLTFPNAFNVPANVTVVHQLHDSPTPSTLVFKDIEIGQYHYDVNGGVFLIDVKGLTPIGINLNDSVLDQGGTVRSFSNDPIKFIGQVMPEDLFIEICNLF